MLEVTEKPLITQIEPMSAVRRTVYLLTAVVFFLLGIVGIVVPGLPTTPFLLLTSFFLVRSSPRLNQRLLDSKWFGPVLRDWQCNGGVRRSVKRQALAVIAVVIPLTVWLTPASVWVKLAVVVLALVGVFVVVRLPIVDQ